jgi:hypothetical protein
MLAECAAVEADLAVVPLLASTVPDTLKILAAGDGLPPLPMFPYQSLSAAGGRFGHRGRTRAPHPPAVLRPLPPRGLMTAFWGRSRRNVRLLRVRCPDAR